MIAISIHQRCLPARHSPVRTLDRWIVNHINKQRLIEFPWARSFADKDPQSTRNAYVSDYVPEREIEIIHIYDSCLVHECFISQTAHVANEITTECNSHTFRTSDVKSPRRNSLNFFSRYGDVNHLYYQASWLNAIMSLNEITGIFHENREIWPPKSHVKLSRCLIEIIKDLPQIRASQTAGMHRKSLPPISAILTTSRREK